MRKTKLSALALTLFSFVTMASCNQSTFEYALVTDVIDDLEVKNGTRDDGTVYGIYSFSRKIGQAIAGGLSGWALSWIGYNELAAGQTEAVANGIYDLATFFPGVIYLACGLVLIFIYPLSKNVVDNNVATLETRRKAQ